MKVAPSFDRHGRKAVGIRGQTNGTLKGATLGLQKNHVLKKCRPFRPHFFSESSSHGLTAAAIKSRAMRRFPEIMMKHVYTFLAILFLVALTGPSASACQCAGEGTPCQQYWEASTVFIGTVIEARLVNVKSGEYEHQRGAHFDR